MALTMNNFGCAYKKVGKPNAALSYLETAFVIEKKVGSNVNDLM
jgi:tetratricopeptide (TPR) repeat protein